jgi:hypothetical protein
MESPKDLIGRLEMLPIRQVFPKEAQHFTTWLETHIEVLSERVGIPLTVIQREKEVGDFNVDLLCEDSDGKPVIIENQVERTDHDHLGKLLTYLVNLDASTAIWVTSEPRVEHQKVIDWLNESTPADIAFFLVKVEAVRIGQSPFAPLFTILAAPDRQTKEVGEKKKEWAERHTHRHEFWISLLDKCREKTKLFSNISPGRYHWLGTGAGKSGLSFNFVIVMDYGGIELYIDNDKDTGQKNKAIFDALYSEKVSIEREFGAELEWERLDDKRASRIRKRFMVGGLATPDNWAALQDSMIDAMVRLEKALKPRLARID